MSPSPAHSPSSSCARAAGPALTQALTHALPPVGGWQRQVGAALNAAMQRACAAHPPADDGAAAAPALATPWRVPPLPLPDSAQGTLAAQCLHHYREQLRPQDRSWDDAGVALACLLAAVLQASDGQPVTPARWGAVNQWLQRDAALTLDWRGAPLAQQQGFFQRLAVLAVALGEWTVQASRQGPAALASARALSADTLRHELQLDEALWLRTAQWLGLSSRPVAV